MHTPQICIVYTEIAINWLGQVQKLQNVNQQNDSVWKLWIRSLLYIVKHYKCKGKILQMTILYIQNFIVAINDVVKNFGLLHTCESWVISQEH